MATNFPTLLDTFTNPLPTSLLLSPSHSLQHSDANDAIEALEAKVGITNSNVTTSLDYRVRNINATTMVVNGPNSSSLSFGDWSNTPTHSAIEGNMGYLLLGKNALDNFNIYLRSNNSIGGVYIGGNNTNTMAVSSSGMSLTGSAIFSGSTSTDLFKITQTGTGNAFVIEDEASDTTPFVISSAGNLRLGGGTSYGTYFYSGTGFNSNPKILGHTFDLFSAGLGAYTWNNGNNGVYTVYSKSRGATIGDMTIVQANDGLSVMVFGGSDGEKFGEAARISVNVDGTPGLNSMPGFIAFSTSPTGTINPSERMRINAVGNVGIGTTAPAARLEVNGSTTIGAQTNVAAEFGTSGGTNNLLVGSVTGNTPFIGSQGASSLLLNTDGVTRMSFNSAGEVGIASPPTSNIRLTITGGSTNSANPVIMLNGVSGSGALYFHNDIAAGSYNGIVTAGSKAIIATGPNGTTSKAALVIAPWSDTAYGIRFTGGATTDILVRGTTTFTSSLAADKALIVKGVASQAGDFIDVQDSSGASQCKVDSAGNFLVGTSTRRSVGGSYQNTIPSQIFTEQGSTGLTAYTSVVNRANSDGLRFILGRSRGTAAGAVTALVSNDSIAELMFAGADGTTLDPLAARIMVHVDGAVATGSVPGRLSFATNPLAGTNPIERMRIDSAGNVGIGITAPTSKLHVVGSFSRGAPVTKTSNFTLADTENWIICNGTTSIAVTLPAASSQVGREITIKNIAAFTVVSASSNIVPINSGTAGTAILPATAGSWVTLVSNGTSWVIMQS